MSTLDFNREEQLSARDEALLRRLLSDPTKLPQPFVAWLISRLETSDMNLPISSIVGLKERLAAASATRDTAVGGQLQVATGASGHATVAFPAAYAAVKSLVICLAGDRVGAPAETLFKYVLSISGMTLNGFTVLAWDPTTDSAYASKTISFSWQAFVTP